MFDISWTEMLVVAVAVIIMVKPADLPGVIRTIGKMTGSVRRMASDFQRQFSEALREADIEQVKNELSRTTSLSSPPEEIRQLAGESGDYPDQEVDAEIEIQEDLSEVKPKRKSALSKRNVRNSATGKKVRKSVSVDRKTEEKRKVMAGGKSS